METLVEGWGLFLVRAVFLLACGWIVSLALASHPRARVAWCRSVFVTVILVLPWLSLLPRVTAMNLPSLPKIDLSTSDFVAGDTRDDASLETPATHPLAPARHWAQLSLRPIDIAFAVWLIGFIFFLICWLIAFARAHMLQSLVSPAPAWINASAERLKLRLSVKARVSVAIQRDICSPILVGPSLMILLPDLDGAFDDIETALAHELAHVQAHDWWWRQWLQVIGAFAWPVPFVWWLRSAHDAACEVVCDHVAAPLVSGSENYARSLARQGLLAHQQWQGASVPMVGRSGLRNRLEWLRTGKTVPPLSGRVLMAGAGVWILFIVFLAGLRSAQGAGEQPIVSASAGTDGGEFDKDNTIIYRATIPDQAWNGWGLAAPPSTHPNEDITPPPEQFNPVDGNNATPRTFSGKVVVEGSMQGVEVGLISLVGIQWNVKDAYQWQPVAADSSFSITDAYHTDAPKALAVRGPHTPWTFLRYNFSPNQSATNIVLKADAPRIVRLTASGADMQDLSQVGYEPFHSKTQYDDEGKPLRRQRFDYYKTGDQKFIDLVLPLGEVAIFVHHEGFAGYYQVIDTRRASHFHFVLRPPGKIKLVVLDQDGHPKSGFQVKWINPAAPLSLGAADMKADGFLLLQNLVPGTFKLDVPGFEVRDVVVDEDKTSEVQLQEGVDP